VVVVHKSGSSVDVCIVTFCESLLLYCYACIVSDNGNFLHVFGGLLVLQRYKLGIDLCRNLVERLCQVSTLLHQCIEINFCCTHH
jgi:hypothetical protein